MSYSDAARKYAEDIVRGALPACEWARRACVRHLTDLGDAANPESTYIFDEECADRACAFVELLPHVKGRWAARRETLVLQPWQVFIFASLFGWRRRRDGLRRYRHAYLAIPRKNGKSTIAAGIGLLMWCADGEYGAEVYCGATTEKQAWEVFGPARNMVKRSQELVDLTGAEVWAKLLLIPEDNSKFEPVIGDPGDGSSPSCAIIDEYHEHQTPDMVDTMVTGMGAREHPLLVQITTSGFNLASPCYDQETEAKKVLQGAVDNPELFVIIHSIDEGDDWTDPANLRKANPNFDISVSGEFLETQLKLALQNPINQNKFKTKHLNVWCSAREAWVNLQQWQGAADNRLKREDFEGEKCVVSLDLASKCDFVSETELYARGVNGKRHYYWFSRYWLPSETVTEPGKNHALYAKWHAQGVLNVTEGATIDYETIALEVAHTIKRSKARELVFDPFNAIALVQDVVADEDLPTEFPLVEFIQKPWNFSVPMDEITAALKDGRLHHDGHPITTWCMANVVAKPGKKDMYSPAKETKEAKIDGAVSGIMAVSRLMPAKAEDEHGSIDEWLNANKQDLP